MNVAVVRRSGMSLLVVLLCGALRADEPARRQIGQMVLQGIPEIDPAVAERMMQYLNVRRAVLLGLSDDGSAMLVGTRFGDTQQVHLVTTPLGMRRQLTFFDEPVRGARFIPGSDARLVIFAKDRGGDERSQFYLLDLQSGRHRLLTDGKARHTGPAISRSGRWLACTGTARNDKDFDLYLMELGPDLAGSASAFQRPPGAGGQGSPPQLAPGGNGPAGADGRAEPGAAAAGSVGGPGGGGAPPGSVGAPGMRRVWEVEGQYYAVDFSPDESQLTVLHYVSERQTEFFLCDVPGGRRGELTPQEPPAYYGGGLWSADGKSIYFTSDRDGEFRKLYRLDLASRRWQCLTGDIEWDVEELAVDPSGQGIAFAVNEDGIFRLYLADPDGGNRREVQGIPRGVLSRLQFAPRGGVLAFTMESASAPSDVYTVGAPFGPRPPGVTRWTASEVGGLNPATFVEPQVIRYPTFDQVDGQPRMIPALYYKGRGEGRRPVVIVAHGGPEGQSLPTFSSLTQYLCVEMGVTVIFPNVRGSTGYGRTFHQLDNGVKRQDAVRDIGALLDWIERQPDLDPQRVGILGGSYGGFMVLAALTSYPERFRAGVDVVGITSFISFLETTPEYRRDLRRAEYGDERVPEVRRVLEEVSPLNKVDRIRAALFVLHGQNDPRVPVSEAEQIVARLRQMGRPVWYALALNEGHGFQKKDNIDLASVLYVTFWQQHLLN